MTSALDRTSEGSGFFPWFRAFLQEETAPYPGRSVMVARMVLAATVTMILIMTFRIPGGFEGALYAFMIARDNLRSTLKSGFAMAASYAIGVLFVLAGAGLSASHPSARLLWFAASMFVVFFAMKAFRDFAVATGFAVLLVLALPIWQMPATAEERVELTLWQALACVLGTVITVLVEAVFRSIHPSDELLEGMDDRLSAVQTFIQEYAAGKPISADVSRRLVKYTMVGVSGLRRILARSRHEPQFRDQLTAVVALTGRLVDLASPTARSPHPPDASDAARLSKLASQIASLRKALADSRIPEPIAEIAYQPTGIPFLPEMERTVRLIPSVFAASEDVDVYFPQLLDQEERGSVFFNSNAFHNPAYIAFAMRGCLATTLCYFTYEMLDWRGISTAVTTCVLTALSNVGTSRQKQFLRITGAVVGGLILGIGSQIFILPYLDSIVSFSLLFAAISAIAAWFATASQRLSYFGLQIANAYYLVTVSGFSFDPSLDTARDRVVGILLGLLVMWFVFHSVGTASAAEHMTQYFSANLRAIGELALQPEAEPSDLALKRIRALRNRIGETFQKVNAQSDAVPFEVGLRQREEGMARRAQIRRWLPQLETIYLLEIALMQHRVFSSEEHLPPAALQAQQDFHRACAALLTNLADSIDGKRRAIVPDLDASLATLTQALRVPASGPNEFAIAHGIEKGARTLSKGLTDLALDIGSAELRVS